MKVWPDNTLLEWRTDADYGETFQTRDALNHRSANDVMLQIKNGMVNNIPITFENEEYTKIFIAGKRVMGVSFGADDISGAACDRNEFNVYYYKMT